MENYIVNPDVKIGHIHLTVSDLNRALDFYKGMLGFEITQWFGAEAVFLSAGNYHHHIGLNTWQGLDATPAPPGHTGLYHFAILYPSRLDLAKIVQRLLSSGYKVEGATDHGTSESIYILDPDRNGIELYCDRPADEWPRDENGYLKMYSKPIDLLSLLNELEKEN